MTVSDVITLLREKTQNTGVPGQVAVFQFHVGGQGGGEFSVETSPDKTVVTPGTRTPVNVEVSIDMADLAGIIEHRVDATGLYFQGKIKIQGDLMLAMRAASLLGK